MDKDKILEKIKKCLALSRSGNPHEAAAALRQAQKLMQAHAITEADVEGARVRESGAKSGAAVHPARWEIFLSQVISKAFDCRVIFKCGRGQWSFLGVESAAEVAGYAFSVLLRQIQKARKEYIGKNLKRCRAGTKVRRADLFCIGYVEKVAALVDSFAGPNPNDEVLDAYIKREYPELRDAEPRKKAESKESKESKGQKDICDVLSGMLAAKDAQLLRPVGSAGNPAGLLA
ncbi:MAG: DUF2786 domain-containing protein [Zoogloeaceae bacterium]|jgi:hypothetical protein|nr:DUF2786 domain-containing protein [Zoogloeaceae bacterium]